MPNKIARRPDPHHALSRRERQIMDVIYKRGSAGVADVIGQLSGKPAYSTVRAQLGVLEQKGYLRHEEDGLRYVYIPAVSRQEARHSMLRHLVDTFFEGSAGQAMTALLGSDFSRLSEQELREISQLIERARKAKQP